MIPHAGRRVLRTPLPLPEGVPQVFDALSVGIYAVSVRGREPSTPGHVLVKTWKFMKKVMFSKSIKDHSRDVQESLDTP